MAKTLKQRYEKLASGDRAPYLTRARDASKLTIPSLIPEAGSGRTTSFENPWQSIGAKGVNNLASKMLLSQFPPNSPFFRMDVDEIDRQNLDQATKGQIDDGLATLERVVVADIEDSKTRSALFQTFKHMIVSGNALINEDEDTGAIRMYPLSRYVVKRDATGNWTEVIATDHTSWGALSEEVQMAVAAGGYAAKDSEADLTIYTGIYRGPKKWKVWQEIEGVVVPGSEGEYPLDACPWIPLRMSTVDGENYGRSFIEEIYGDLNTVDALTQAISEGSAASAIVKFLVDPNGTTEADELIEADNGGFVTGRQQDVSVLQVNKFADLRVAREMLAELKADLSSAFLMHQSIQRNAERVTAEEIRYMAQELEDALGGIYSMLAQELQLPLVKSRLRRLQKLGKVPQLPKFVKPKIITGLEALGRSHEHQRLRMFVADAAQTFGPDVISEYMKVDEYLKRASAAMNVDTKDFVRSDAEVQQRRQQAAEMQAQLQMEVASASQPQPQPKQ